jgi:hypothetical protein
MQSNYKMLNSNASTLTSEVEDIIYAWSKSITDIYALLGDILGVNEYDELTGISTYGIPVEPVLYDPSINNATPTHKHTHKEED